MSVSVADLEDATEELLVAIQREVDAAEQNRFERASLQATRFLEDRVLVQRRRKTNLLRQLNEAQARRDAAVGSEAREEAEVRLAQLDVKLAEVDAVTEKLEGRDNEVFQRFHDHIHRRRFSPPVLELLLELELTIE